MLNRFFNAIQEEPESSATAPVTMGGGVPDPEVEQLSTLKWHRVMQEAAAPISEGDLREERVQSSVPPAQITESTQASEKLIEQILSGTEHIISHPGSSQYGGRDGISACGLACLNFARVLFAKEASGGNLLQTVIASETALVGLWSHIQIYAL